MKQHWQMPGTGSEDAGALTAFGFQGLPTARVRAVDPAVSERQRKFMGAELGRRRRGQKTRTKMTTTQLEEFAHKPKGGY